jgi:hypothetical protein
MKSFHALTFDHEQCSKELDELRVFLTQHDSLNERDDILPFFNARVQLASMIGCFNPYIAIPDLIAFEYDIFGDFTADLVIGDSQNNAYSFVEFEDAKENSIFTSSKRTTSSWSNRFQQGFGQLVDWCYKLNDVNQTAEFEERFHINLNHPLVTYECLLIVGRSKYITKKDLRRLMWFRDHVYIDSKRIYCLTFDELYDNLSKLLRFYTSAI